MPDALVGATIDERYEILSLIGEGNRATVYLAKHLMLNKLVALKLFKEELISDTKSLSLFEQESRITSALTHENIVKLYDFGRTATGVPFIVMDYMPGGSLSDKMKQGSPLPESFVIPVILQACEGLSFAHNQGIIHRDIKPANILFAAELKSSDVLEHGLVKLVDFGLARVLDSAGGSCQTTTAGASADPRYVSPEQAARQPADGRSDVYSLGCLLYEALTGKTLNSLHQSGTTSAGMLSPLKKLRNSLADLISTAVQKDPAKRFKSVEDFRQALLKATDQQEQAVASVRIRRKMLLAITYALLTFCLCAAAIYFAGTAQGKIWLLNGLITIQVSSGQGDKVVATSRRKLARMLEQANRLDQAIPLFKLLVQTAIANKPNANELEKQAEWACQTADDYFHLALCFRQRGEKQQMNDCLRLANDLLVDSSITFGRKGHAELTLPCTRKQLEIRKVLLGPSASDTLISYCAVAQSESTLHHFDKARQVLAEAKQYMSDADSDELTWYLHNQGNIAQVEGNFALAERCFLKELSVLERIHPQENDLSNALVFGALGGAYLQDKKYIQSAAAIEKERQILKNLGELNSKDYVYVSNVLADASILAGKLKDATTTYEFVVPRLKKVDFDGRHPLAVFHLALCYLVHPEKWD